MNIDEMKMILNNYEYNKIHTENYLNYLKRSKKDTIINYNTWKEIRKTLKKKAKIKEAQNKYGNNINYKYFKNK